VGEFFSNTKKGGTCHEKREKTGGEGKAKKVYTCKREKASGGRKRDQERKRCSNQEKKKMIVRGGEEG